NCSSCVSEQGSADRSSGAIPATDKLLRSPLGHSKVAGGSSKENGSRSEVFCGETSIILVVTVGSSWQWDQRYVTPASLQTRRVFSFEIVHGRTTSSSSSSRRACIVASRSS